MFPNKNILVVIHSNTHARLLQYYIEILSKESFKLYILCVKKECVKNLKNLPKNVKLIYYYKKSINFKPIKFKIFNPLLFFIWQIRLLIYSRFLLDQINPSKIVLSSDRYLEVELQLAKLCIKRSVPTFVVGIDFLYADSVDYYSRGNRIPISNKWYFNIFNKFFPDQIFYSKSNAYTFYRVYYCVILKLLGLLPSKPFLSGFDFASFVLVDCLRTKEIYESYGACCNKIIIVGSPEHDKLFSYLNLNTYDNKKIVLALPQLYEHNLLDYKTHVIEIEYLVQVLSNLGQKTTICIHPKQNISDYLYLEDYPNILVSRKFLVDEISNAKIFISTYSSTVLWSVLCEIPCILIDFYSLKYNLFNDINGVFKFTNKIKFESYLRKLSTCKKTYEKHKLLQVNDSKNYGILDGKSLNRILHIFNES